MNPLSVGLYAAFFFLARYLLFNFIFQPFARKSGIVEKKALLKFCESAFKVVYYLPVWVVGFYLASTNGWLTDTKELWRGYPNQPIPSILETFYEFQLGFYIFLQITHVFFDVKQKDYYALLIHHFTTIALISLAWWYSYFRIGVVVFFTMDLVDVFLEVARVFHYLKYDTVANFFFVSLILSWFFFRVFLFSYLVITSAWFEALEIHILEKFDYTMTTWYLFNALLWVILVLQVYWMYYLVLAAKNIIAKGKIANVLDIKEEKSKHKNQ
eukprot:TRINITY_DN4550_c0_g1_i1.p1 TRINITY_DN4550_c0_g1~~TRINITY_DN4550_c0_g1_i1.p1  ORF type:complete len:270 (+),score=48.14 TRINITY_DN4550_c0_g1_i1:120-929(+)